MGDRFPQGGDVPVPAADQHVDGLRHPLPLGDLAEDVKPVLYHGVLGLEHIVVKAVHLRVEGIFGAFRRKSQVSEHVHLTAHLPHFRGDGRELVRLPLAPGLQVLLHRELQAVDAVIAPGTGHRRDQVRGGHRELPAFRLHPLARVIDYVGIDVGHSGQYYVRIALGRQPRRFSGKPFQGPVGPDMDDRIRFPHILQPAVECKILVRGRGVRVMIGFGSAFPAVWLEPYEHVPVHYPGQDQVPVQGMYVPRRFAPCIGEGLLHLLRDLREPFRILLWRHQVHGGPPHLLVGMPIVVVGDPRQEPVGQVPGAFGDPVDGIALRPHLRQQPADALHGIEAVASARQVLPRRVHVDEYRDLLALLWDTAQPRPPHRHLRERFAAVRDRGLPVLPVLGLLRPAVGDAVDVPVIFRGDDAHRDVRGREPERALLPIIRAAVEVHRLDHGDPETGEEIVRGLLLPAPRHGDDGQREPHGVDDSVDDRSAAAQQISVYYLRDAQRPGRGIGIGMQEDADRLPAGLPDLIVQEVDGVGVVPYIVRVDEENHYSRPSGPPDVLQALFQGQGLLPARDVHALGRGKIGRRNLEVRPSSVVLQAPDEGGAQIGVAADLHQQPHPLALLGRAGEKGSVGPVEIFADPCNGYGDALLARSGPERIPVAEEGRVSVRSYQDHAASADLRHETHQFLRIGIQL